MSRGAGEVVVYSRSRSLGAKAGASVAVAGGSAVVAGIVVVGALKLQLLP